ncbi:MAG: dihydroneopterin aldolase, partial [Bacteroidales bacterium]
AYHGTTMQERKIGNNYKVKIKVCFNISAAMNSDSINDTINYADLYDIVKCEMMMPSNLIENVAGRIMAAVKKNFPQVTGGKIEVTKIKPPIAGDVAGASVIVKW